MENKKKHQFLVGIPTINRADLLNEVLPKYYEDFYKNDIFIIDNGNQNIIEREEKFHLLKPNKNLGVDHAFDAFGYLCLQQFNLAKPETLGQTSFRIY